MAQFLKSGPLTARQMLDMPPFWLLAAIVLVWAQVRWFPGGTAAQPWSAALGAVLFWGGLALIGWTLWTFRSQRTTVVPHNIPARLITTGPFRFSRNPIYLGDLMVLAGVILGYGAWAALPLLPALLVILQRRFVAPEEARMKDSFGAEFRAYREKTRRWL